MRAVFLNSETRSGQCSEAWAPLMQENRGLRRGRAAGGEGGSSDGMRKLSGEGLWKASTRRSGALVVAAGGIIREMRRGESGVGGMLMFFSIFKSCGGGRKELSVCSC